MDLLESGWNLWVWLVGVVSRRWVWLVGGIYGYGYNVLVRLVAVVVRRYVYRYPHNNCERSELVIRVGSRISLVYIYICIHERPFGPAWSPSKRATRKRLTGRLRFNGQYNRLENGYFSSKP